MSGFTILGADEVLRAVITWGEANWPVPLNALGDFYQALGWVPFEDDPGVFSTRPGGTGTSGYYIPEGDAVRKIRLFLIKPVPEEHWVELEEYLAPVFEQICQVLIGRWGQPLVSHDPDGALTNAWDLSNGARVTISKRPGGMFALIVSPQQAHRERKPLDDRE
ncbi:MAG: DUF6301 family protein [Actinomycetaceae bacterium]|nr:DUF6301 family protein [Actinomycetaceae bacterium]